MMKMYFHTDCNNETLLFENWIVNEGDNLFKFCTVIFFMGLGYGFLQMWLNIYRKWYLNVMVNAVGEESGFLGFVVRNGIVYRGSCLTGHFFAISETVFQMGIYFYAYMLMLIFMTYQVHFCLSLCAGLGLSNLIFISSKQPIRRAVNSSEDEELLQEDELNLCCE